VEGNPEGGAQSEIEVSPPPRQRWRLVLARSAGAAMPAGRELSEAWDTALQATGLPAHWPAGKARAHVAFGAPVPASIALECELADLVLTELVPRWRVRETLVPVVPEGWRLVDLHDVWLGEPPLAGQVAAADYRIELEGADAETIASAAADLLAADRLIRERTKGAETVQYDLRPLLVDVAVISAGPPVVRARTRFHATLGTGRPEEVVAALGEAAGRALDVGAIVRERVILARELPP
jgi:Uncharacterized protein conserved in bacteria (DUF2344)